MTLISDADDFLARFSWQVPYDKGVISHDDMGAPVARAVASAARPGALDDSCACSLTGARAADGSGAAAALEDWSRPPLAGARHGGAVDKLCDMCGMQALPLGSCTAWCATI